MNDDNYVEWLVKRKDPAYAIPLKILMIVLCVISAFLAMQTIFGLSFSWQRRQGLILFS